MKLLMKLRNNNLRVKKKMIFNIKLQLLISKINKMSPKKSKL